MRFSRSESTNGKRQSAVDVKKKRNGGKSDAERTGDRREFGSRRDLRPLCQRMDLTGADKSRRARIPFTTVSPAFSTRSIGDAILGKPSQLALTDKRILADQEARQDSPLLAPCYDFFYF